MLAAHIARIHWIHTPAIEVGTFWSRTTTWLARARCGLGGHSMVRHFEPRRLSLQCISCGEETPGWTL